MPAHNPCCRIVYKKGIFALVVDWYTLIGEMIFILPRLYGNIGEA
jgi:hypothetical protein